MSEEWPISNSTTLVSPLSCSERPVSAASDFMSPVLLVSSFTTLKTWVSNFSSPELPTLSLASQTDLYLTLQTQEHPDIDSNVGELPAIDFHTCITQPKESFWGIQCYRHLDDIYAKNISLYHINFEVETYQLKKDFNIYSNVIKY